MTNPFIIIKNWIRRKITDFIYPETNSNSNEIVKEIFKLIIRKIKKVS